MQHTQGFRNLILEPALRVKFIALAAVMSVSLLAACQPPGAPLKPSTTTPTSPRPLSELSSDEKVAMADVFVDELEEILLPSRFHEAQQKLAEALTYDPNNVRAQFWSNFLNVVVEFNGLIVRLRPYYESQTGGAERWAKLDRELLPATTDEWRAYIRTPRSSNGPGLTSTEDIRLYLDRVTERAEVFRLWLKANREREFTLRMPQELVGNNWFVRGSSQRCVSPGMGPLRLVSRNCGPGAMFEAKVNRADLDFMQIWFGSLQMQLVLAQAYLVNPQFLIDVPKSNEKDFVRMLLSQQSGQLRAQNQLSLFKELTSEALIAMRFAMQRRSELCPRGNFSISNRPGYMMSVGLCVDPSENSAPQRTMAVMESLLAGRPVRVESGDADLEIHALKLIEQPPASIDFLNRAKFDSCRQIEGFEPNDQATLQAYVASGRLESLLRSSARACRPEGALPPNAPGPTTLPSPGDHPAPQRSATPAADWHGGAP